MRATRSGMMAVFAAMLGALGGSFEPVRNSPDEPRKRHNPPPRAWWRPADLSGYRVVHGTFYRTWTKRSKKERAKEKRLAKRISQREAVLTTEN